MEALYNLQHKQPRILQSSKYKIQKKGHREQSRIKHYFNYGGPDHATTRLLAANAQKWTADPNAFWSHSIQVSPGSCPQSELITFYLKAQCDDA